MVSYICQHLLFYGDQCYMYHVLTITFHILALYKAFERVIPSFCHVVSSREPFLSPQYQLQIEPFILCRAQKELILAPPICVLGGMNILDTPLLHLPTTIIYVYLTSKTYPITTQKMLVLKQFEMAQQQSKFFLSCQGQMQFYMSAVQTISLCRQTYWQSPGGKFIVL